MTFGEIRADICRRLDKNAVTLDPETKARLDTFINDRYRELLRLDGINLRDESTTLTTVPQQARYALPSTVTSIYNIVDNMGRPLRQTTLAAIRGRGLPSSSGTPTHYAILNAGAVTRQPSVKTAGALELTTGPTGADVIIEFQEQTSGDFQTVSVALSPTLAVTVPPAVGVVFRIYSDTVLTAPVTLREKVSLQVIAALPVLGASVPGQPNKGTSHAWVVQLWPVPAAAYTFLIDFARPRRTLVDDTDEPAIPEEFHTLLVWGGCAEECIKMDDNRTGHYEGKYQDDVRRLRAFLHMPRGQRWIPTGGRSRAISDLPGNYPAG